MHSLDQTEKAQTEKAKRTTTILLIGILVLGFFLRIIAWRLDPIISRDGAFYLVEAQKWSQSPSSFQYDQPPLLMFILKIFYQIGMNAEFYGCLLNILMGIVLVFATYKITVLLFNNQTAGLCAAFVMAVHPYLIQVSYQIQRESIYFALISIILWRLVKIGCCGSSEKDSYPVDFILIGVLLALAVLSRHEGWLFFPFLLIVSFFYGVTNHPLNRILKQLSFFLLSFSATFLMMAFMTNFFPNVEYIIKSQFLESFGAF